MRISDWSSDVCSSDLPDRKAMQEIGSLLHDKSWLMRLGAVRATESFPTPKIGRASCRERVCKYVLISVVAVLLKIKHDLNSITMGRSCLAGVSHMINNQIKKNIHRHII